MFKRMIAHNSLNWLFNRFEWLIKSFLIRSVSKFIFNWNIRIKLSYFGRYTKTNSLEKALMLGKLERKRRGWPTARLSLHPWKTRSGRDCQGENLTIWLLGVDSKLMAHNQSINLKINVSCSTIMRQVQWTPSTI